MIARIALVFAGIVLFGVFFNLYGLAMIFVTTFLLGINDGALLILEQGLAYMLGAVTAVKLLQPSWQKLPPLTPIPPAATAKNETDIS